MQQWEVNYWDKYAQVVNWIIARYLSGIENEHEFPSKPIDFVPGF